MEGLGDLHANFEKMNAIRRKKNVVFQVKEYEWMVEPSHFPFKIQTKLDNSSIINFSYISLRQDVKRK